ncbi:MFS transporter [Streptomyces sp. NPDC059002]|uniref:MFS transporter n=1 Tax=Streptomyces sp. NPDC059002 TaxID=3346690 RepID=UPI0036C2111A
MAGYAISAYGNFLNLIALSLFTYEVVGSAFGIGAVMALRLFSGMLAGLGAGALTTALGRRTVMIGTDVAQALAMALLAVGAHDPSLVLLLGAVVVLGAGNTLFTVALRSAVPVLVGHDERSRANGLLVAGRSAATVLGYGSAAAVIASGGYALAFAVNSASFVVSAAVVLVLRPRTDAEGTTYEEPSKEPVTGRRGRGVRLGIAGIPALLAGALLLRGADAFASSSHNVALPIVADLESPDNPALFMTRFWAAWAVGALLSHQVLKRFRREEAYGERAFALGTAAMAVFFVLVFVLVSAGSPAPALIAAALAAGLADGCTEIVYVSRLQAAPERERSRLLGISASAETAGFTLGMVAAAAALEGLPVLAVVAAFHGTALCGALALLAFAAARRRGGGAAPATSQGTAPLTSEGTAPRTPEGTAPPAHEGTAPLTAQGEGGAHGTRTGAGPLSGA